MAARNAQILHDRADALYDRYGAPLESDHWGEFVIIAVDGRAIIAPTLIAAAQAAERALLQGGFAFKIGERSVATWK